MVFKFKMPDIGEGLQEGEIVSWLVKEGDDVTEDQPIVEVMTDKATVELPSPRTGTIKRIIHGEGTVVPVGDVFVEIDEDGASGGDADDDSAASASGPTDAEAVATDADEDAPTTDARSQARGPKEEKMLFEASSPSAGGHVTGRRAKAPEQNAGGNGAASGEAGGKVLATPATRKLARENDIDLSQVDGSGPHGRILKSDVQAFMESGGAGAQTQVQRGRAAATPSAPAAQAVAVQDADLEERVPMKGLRRVIADAMARSKRTAAHFTYVEEVDARELVAMRARAKKVALDQGLPTFTYLPILVKAVVAALKRFPQANMSYDETSQELVYKNYYHIGIAVATEAGLIVPVIKDADKKTMFQIQEEIIDLAERTREGKAKPDELRGSTFTITSLGKAGGMLATPVLNYPEVAIMGVHAIKDKPVVDFDESGEAKVVPGKLMNLSFSFDHRVIDGQVGADFAQTIVRYVENPELLLLDS